MYDSQRCVLLAACVSLNPDFLLENFRRQKKLQGHDAFLAHRGLEQYFRFHILHQK